MAVKKEKFALEYEYQPMFKELVMKFSRVLGDLFSRYDILRSCISSIDGNLMLVKLVCIDEDGNLKDVTIHFDKRDNSVSTSGLFQKAIGVNFLPKEEAETLRRNAKKIVTNAIITFFDDLAKTGYHRPISRIFFDVNVRKIHNCLLCEDPAKPGGYKLFMCALDRKFLMAMNFSKSKYSKEDRELTAVWDYEDEDGRWVDFVW